MNLENIVEQEVHQPSFEVSEDLGDKYCGNESFFNDSSVSENLDFIPVMNEVQLEFKQENLLKQIPHKILISIIASNYPELVTEQNMLTIDTLREILREGANLNWLEWLSEEIITDLAVSLVGFIQYLVPMIIQNLVSKNLGFTFSTICTFFIP